MEAGPVFRATKRRKLVRSRPGHDLDDAHNEPPSDLAKVTAQVAHSNDDNQQDDDVAVSELIRARRLVRRPVAGVQFSNKNTTHETGDEEMQSLVKTNMSPDRPINITTRFVGSTGQVVNDDKHMVAFIDSELAKKRNTPVPSSQSYGAAEAQLSAMPSRTSEVPSHKSATANPAVARQLAEVDLGTFVHDTNRARTEAALERVRTGQAPIEQEIKPPKPRKPRIGRDGKPMKPRPKKRRNSEDMARDALVEQFLRDNKIDMYDTSTPEPKDNMAAAGKDVEEGDPDERFAEQFRQEFMDAMAERKNKTKTAPPVKGAVPAEARGPKLGGSRSARAKMAQIQQQQQPTSSKK